MIASPAMVGRARLPRRRATMSDGSAPKNYSKFQQKVIKRYYDNLGDIKHQRLSDLVGEWYLAEGKKKEKIWKAIGETMTQLGLPPARVEHLMAQRNPTLIAELIKEL